MKKTSVQPVEYIMGVFLYLFPSVICAQLAIQIQINYNFINVNHTLCGNYINIQSHIFPHKTNMPIQGQTTFSLLQNCIRVRLEVDQDHLTQAVLDRLSQLAPKKVINSHEDVNTLCSIQTDKILHTCGSLGNRFHCIYLQAFLNFLFSKGKK